VLGYDFIHVVTILLPISLSINIIQISKDYRYIDLIFYKKILFYTVPFIVLFLFVVTRITLNINIFIGLFLLFVAAKNFSVRMDNTLKSLVRHERGYFACMGIVHGLTNLGGSLLTAIVHSKDYEKHEARATIAVSYGTFALFQMLTLLLSGYRSNMSFSGLGMYLAAGLIIFIFTEKLVYTEINKENYTRGFATFLLLSGLLLCVKHF